MFESVKHAAAYLENREGGGGKGQEGATSPKDCALRSSLEGLFGEIFRRRRAPEDAYRRLQAGKAPGGTFRGDLSSVEGALQLHFPCKTFAMEGRRTIAKGAKGAALAQCPPLPAPLLVGHLSKEGVFLLSPFDI